MRKWRSSPRNQHPRTPPCRLPFRHQNHPASRRLTGFKARSRWRRFVATYAETISRICDDLSRPDEEIGTIVGREILSAIEYYDGWRFAFNERVLEVTLSATNTYQYSYLVSGDTQLQAVMQIDEVKVTNSGHEYLVERVPWGEFQRLDKDASSTTIPDYWSVYNKRLFLWPTPNADLPAKITAHVKFVAISRSTVVENAWLN